MEFFIVLLFIGAVTVIAGCIARDAASVPAPEYPAPPTPVKEYLDQNDFPETDPVVFGRYCLMEHQPWECQSYVVYPYDAMHGIYPDDSNGPEFLFQYREDALEYMDIYDGRAEAFQRRDNLLHGLEADFGIPDDEPEFDWDVFFDNLDDEEAVFDDIEETLS